MNSIKPKQGQKKTSTQINRTQHNRAISSRANNTNNTILANIQNNPPLYNRELSLQSITNDAYVIEVTEAVKWYALESIQLLNQVLIERSPALSIQATANDGMQQLAFSACEGYSNISKFGLLDLYNERSKFACTFDELLKKASNDTSNLGSNISQPHYPEAKLNAFLCWDTLVTLFQKYFTYEADRELFLQIKYTQTSNDIMVQNVNAIIKEAIIGLEKIKNECYFSLFRIIIDPSLDYKFKISKVANYITGGFKESYFLQESIVERVLASSKETIIYMAGYVSKLQILQDCLKKISHAPKTLNNLNVVYKILTDCHSYYKKDLGAFKKLKASRATQYGEDYFTVKSFLIVLARKLSDQMNDAAIQYNALAEKIKSTNQNISSTNFKGLDNKNKKHEQEKQEELIIAITDKTQQTTTEIPLSLKNHEVIEINQKNQEILITQMENNEPITDKIIIDEDTDEDNLDDLEPETNVLMEALRQLFEKDRAAKLELKKIKLNKPKIVIEQKTHISNLAIQPKPAFEILNPKHQETLKALFQEKPGHLTISGKDVQSLIKALGGKSKGATGSQLNIFWQGSNKHAGEYEVTHGGDTPGFLTSGYATRVADAIHIGLKHACIEKELFPQTLLIIIENHTMSNNGPVINS